MARCVGSQDTPAGALDQTRATGRLKLSWTSPEKKKMMSGGLVEGAEGAEERGGYGESLPKGEKKEQRVLGAPQSMSHMSEAHMSVVHRLCPFVANQAAEPSSRGSPTNSF